MNSDTHFMKRCLSLAQKGSGLVSPNPMVGCVIVYKNQIIGEGFHQKYGSHHAEIEAINSVENKELLKASTLYVNMEPCSIHGNTPPCCEAITRLEIPKVVIGYIDIDERVNGNGILFLERHGVEVIQNILHKECLQLNKAFYTFHQKKRPFIVLKWAQSQDGFIGKKNIRTAISNSISNQLVHQWRSEIDAILVGTQTVQVDNPSLTTRLVPGKDPVRLVIDRKLAIATDSNIYSKTGRVVLFNEIHSSINEHVECVKLDFTEDITGQILDYCYQSKILSLLIEGGAITLTSFINQGLWNECRIITSNQLLEEGVSAPHINVLASDTFYLDEDQVSIHTNHP